ncbi:hypothetical protein [Rhizobium leguminosarum]
MHPMRRCAGGRYEDAAWAAVD